MKHKADSLPQGTALCYPCRSVRRQMTPPLPPRVHAKACARCGEAVPPRRWKFCSDACCAAEHPKPVSSAWRGPAQTLTPAQRGYGAAHKAERKRRLGIYSPADPCGYCHKPLGPNTGQWHLPHNEERTGYLPGFWHARCNRLDGAKRGQKRQAELREGGGLAAWNRPPGKLARGHEIPLPAIPDHPVTPPLEALSDH